MTPSAPHTAPDNDTPPPPHPGSLLRAAREASGLSYEDVAAALRLDVKTIIALEDDDYKGLPPATFVIGYLRGYARLLDVSADELLGAYHHHIDTSPPKLSEIGRERSPVVKRPERQPRKGVYFAVVAVALAGLVYWQKTQLQPPAPVISVSPLPPPAALNTPPAVPLPASADATMPTPPSVAHATSATVKLRFTAPSWADVRDNQGQRLLSGNFKVGEDKTVTGAPPLKVDLGNAPGVAVEYNGIAFDAKPYTRGNVATFMLGNAAD